SAGEALGALADSILCGRLRVASLGPGDLLLRHWGSAKPVRAGGRHQSCSLPQAGRVALSARRSSLHGAAGAVDGGTGAEQLQLERLDLQELLEAEAPELAPVAGLLVAAKRGERVECATIDLDLPGADAPRDPLGALLVSGPHTSGETVDGVVRDPHRVLVVLVGHDR